MFEELVDERFDKINPDDLIYHFRGNTARKRYDDFKNEIKLFNELKSVDMQLEDEKKQQTVEKRNKFDVIQVLFKPSSIFHCFN